MPATAKITLGGDEYTLHMFTLGQIERVTELMDDESVTPTKRSFTLIPIVLECVEPVVPDAKALRATVEEISAAIRAAMRLSGLAEEPANPPPAAAA